MENDRECPICYQENQKILSKIRQPDKLLTQAWLDMFHFRWLENSAIDGENVINFFDFQPSKL